MNFFFYTNQDFFFGVIVGCLNVGRFFVAAIIRYDLFNPVIEETVKTTTTETK